MQNNLSIGARCCSAELVSLAVSMSPNRHLMRPYLANRSSTSERRTSLGRLPTYTVLLAMEAGSYLHDMVNGCRVAESGTFGQELSVAKAAHNIWLSA